ncbi:Integrin beta-5, partial [Frankliniella fusca]
DNTQNQTVNQNLCDEAEADDLSQVSSNLTHLIQNQSADCSSAGGNTYENSSNTLFTPTRSSASLDNYQNQTVNQNLCDEAEAGDLSQNRSADCSSAGSNIYENSSNSLFTPTHSSASLTLNQNLYHDGESNSMSQASRDSAHQSQNQSASRSPAGGSLSQNSCNSFFTPTRSSASLNNYQNQTVNQNLHHDGDADGVSQVSSIPTQQSRNWSGARSATDGTVSQNTCNSLITPMRSSASLNMNQNQNAYQNLYHEGEADNLSQLSGSSTQQSRNWSAARSSAGSHTYENSCNSLSSATRTTATLNLNQSQIVNLSHRQSGDVGFLCQGSGSSSRPGSNSHCSATHSSAALNINQNRRPLATIQIRESRFHVVGASSETHGILPDPRDPNFVEALNTPGRKYDVKSIIQKTTRGPEVLQTLIQ